MLMLLVLGFIALGVEISQLLLEQRKQQSVADSAAMAAASAVKLGVSDLQAEARAVTAQLGYENGVNGVTVTATNPPATGSHAGDTKYTEVKVEKTFTPALTQLFRHGSFTVLARSLAIAGQSSSACLLALDTSAANAVDINNGGIVSLPGCGVISNSNSNSAIHLNSNAMLSGSVVAVGDVAIDSGAAVSGSIVKHATAATDPYASVALPTKPTQQLTAASKPTSPLTAGWYPLGWNFGTNANVSLGAGVYWVGSQLSLASNVTLTGSNVTIIIDGNYAILTGSNNTITLSAPTSNTYNTRGIVFYSSKNNNFTTHTFSANGVLTVNGALYFPNQGVNFYNNLVTTNSACTQVVARTIQVQNNANLTFNSSCTGTSVSQLGSSSPASLVE